MCLIVFAEGVSKPGGSTIPGRPKTEFWESGRVPFVRQRKGEEDIGKKGIATRLQTFIGDRRGVLVLGWGGSQGRTAGGGGGELERKAAAAYGPKNK